MSNLLALAILLLSTTPAPTAGDQSFCSDATYKRDSTYMSTLRSLAGALTADAARLHSATGAAGEDPDRVYGAVLCRADSAGANCARRLQDALDAINGDGNGHSPCALHRDVAVYSELYQLRFSDRNFLASFSNAPEWVDVTNPATVPLAVAAEFDERVTELLGAVADAAAGRPGRWAVGEAPWSSSGERVRMVYGLAQCTWDMPPEHCRACLDGLVAERRQKIGSSKMGAAVFAARCTVRYEMDLVAMLVTKISYFCNPSRIQLAPRSRVNQSGVHIGTPKFLQKLLSPITDDFVYHVQGRRKTVRSSSLRQLTLRRFSVHACFSGG